MPRYQHGGASDALWDFSTNANCLGPCSAALKQIMAADLSCYPQADYAALITALAAWHGVQTSRIALGASASELIMRLNLALNLIRSNHASTPFAIGIPQPAYGDYAAAATACSHTIVDASQPCDVQWITVPSSPLGQTESLISQRSAELTWIDCAYMPLMLSGELPPLTCLDDAWQIWTPNKALGLCGVRGAYAIAPATVSNGFENFPYIVSELEPSWVLGAASVAMLQAWVSAPVQDWLADSRSKLMDLKTRQIDALQALHITCKPSQTNFMCVQLHPNPIEYFRRLHALRQCGIALRDTTNMGLPGWARMRVHTQAAQDAFVQIFSNL